MKQEFSCIVFNPEGLSCNYDFPHGVRKLTVSETNDLIASGKFLYAWYDPGAVGVLISECLPIHYVFPRDFLIYFEDKTVWVCDLDNYGNFLSQIKIACSKFCHLSFL